MENGGEAQCVFFSFFSLDRMRIGYNEEESSIGVKLIYPHKGITIC